MTSEAPRFKIRVDEGEEIENADGAVGYVGTRLGEECGWQGREGRAGWALARLFGRLTELTINRLNQVPNKHFLAFLNQAGVDLIPPRPAGAEISFTPAGDGTAFIRVPAGTQVATEQTETQPEVIFETQRDIVVAPNALVKCFAFDPVDYSDRTSQATGGAPASVPNPVAQRPAFAAFQGEKERERVLYLGDDQLFTFPDAASRQAAAVTLSFTVDVRGDAQADGWKLEWCYWNGEDDWIALEPGNVIDSDGQVEDQTNNFSQHGKVILGHLPELGETETVDGEPRVWISCKLAGGGARDHLPVLRSVEGSREIDISQPPTATIDSAFSAVQANTAFVPLNLTDEFFPLGQYPGRLDTLYLRCDEAFSKQGATVTLHMNLAGVNAPKGDTTELENLKVEWQYHGQDGWVSLGTSTYTGVDEGSKQQNFNDETNAFTASGADKTVKFDVFEQGETASLFKKTTVNGQEGYWVRARLMDGSYNMPWKEVEVQGGAEGETETWIIPQTYPPLINKLVVTYSSVKTSTKQKAIQRVRSRVDGMGRDHSPDLESAQPFAPFCTAEEGPALYLGFRHAFPAGEWIQLLLDVDEEQDPWRPSPSVFWEYWNGGQWSPLRVSDGSRGLSERGYLGFFAPRDHQPGTEFDAYAHWLRARPPRSQPRPLALAGDDQPDVPGIDGQATLTLDASGSHAFRCQTLTRYTWRLLSSSPLVANAGPDQPMVATEGDEATIELDASLSQNLAGGAIHYTWRLLSSNPLVANVGPDKDRTVTTPGDEATVELDASLSQNLAGGAIHYTWRKVKPKQEEETAAIATPYLRAVRLNTALALNATTIREEALGSSDGKPGQRFSLLRPPVLPGAQIALREPDRPPDDELGGLQTELRQVDQKAQALLSTDPATPGQGVWVRWHQVTDFYASTPASRHFSLDPISGQVRFGDGERGKIPPIARDNIKAVVYRTHNGAKGNLPPGAISVLRNPSGDLAEIKSATNPEAAAGGSEAEMLDEVMRRGPQRLKHRQRAVTVEDFAWLALEASGELAHARCLPTRNRLGVPEAGWVTVVITPESTAPRPTPSPALMRRVRTYLENHALANLKEANQIHVKGPEYVEATALARVVPVEPEKADEVELAVLARLEAFLHPLRGGPERSGWELGRDVYLSEVHAEIEAVPGVDYVAGLRLLSSAQQVRLRLRAEGGEAPGYREAPYEVPVDSQVSTFDERIKLLLAEPVHRGEELRDLAVYGFKVGDAVTIVAADNRSIKDNLKIASLSDVYLTLDPPFAPPSGWEEQDAEERDTLALMSPDGRLRLPLDKDGITLNEEGQVTGAVMKGFKVGDKLSLVVGTRRDPALEFLPISEVEPYEDGVFVPEGHLVYSGEHDIEMVLE